METALNSGPDREKPACDVASSMEIAAPTRVLPAQMPDSLCRMRVQTFAISLCSSGMIRNIMPTGY